MEKRFIVFIIISMFILLGSQYLFPTAPKPKAPAEAPAIANSTTSEEPAVKATEPAEALKLTAPQDAEELVLVETDLFSATLSSRGGTIKNFIVKEHKNKAGESLSILKDSSVFRALAIGVADDFSYSDNLFEVQGGNITISGESTASVTFRLVKENFSITRKYTFNGNTYAFDLDDKVTGLPAYWITLGANFGIHDKSDAYSHVGPVVLADSDREEFKAGKVDEPETLDTNIKWIALEDKYFTAAIAPREKMESAQVWQKLDATAVALKGPAGEHSMRIYAGPKVINLLKAQGMGLEHIVDFGFFSIIARPIFWLLQWLHSYLGNYGWSIILLTIIIRIPFIPIVSKGQKAMKRMQELQPKINEIRERHKKNPDKMNQEIMLMYKKHNANPLGGCLPLLLQIPVFFALYKVLLVSIELRGAPWILWVTDLSAKDPYYVLPLIMGASMFIQQKITPAAGDPKQQKIMMFLPLIFTVMFLNFASGLVLYWMINNLLSIAQQVVVNRSKD